MASERGIVLELRDQRALIQTQRRSSCQSCQLENSCGQGLISKLGSEKSMEFWVDNSLDAQVGQTVTIDVPDEGLLYASVLMFLVPLIIMLASAGLALATTENELFSIFAGVIGLLAGFYFARVKSQSMQNDSRFVPVLNTIQLSSAEGGACFPSK
ncbi:MAG: SoxR reducing system RseC family protein [Oleiphilaceae bacterium]|nr:SoxR reducing system RseC family protein [Oleiphilaceae bacterium]